MAFITYYDGSSIRDRLVRQVQKTPGKSATQLAKLVDAKVESASSILKRLSDQGVLVRRDGLGPRGGFCYWTREDALKSLEAEELGG